MQTFQVQSGIRQVWEQLSQRPVYIWGAGQQGRGMGRVLERQGVRLGGFLDSSPQLQGRTALGYPISPPEAILQPPVSNGKLFVIVASFFFEKDIMERCRVAGLEEGLDFISYKDLKPFDYAVDISGACNLRCLSCPRATRSHRHPAAGFMTPPVFTQVIDKILDEDPLVGNLQLYQWGEPLLNPHLPEILEIANARGLPCALSSNLNATVDFERVIAAGPSWFRISVSGVGKEYEHTHTGAKWTRLVKNLETLAELRARLQPDMKTEVYYHLYRHNRRGSLEEVRRLCERFEFEFHPVWAYLISLDDVLEYLEGGTLTPQAAEASGMLALSLEQGMALARREIREKCLVDRCIHINWNLTVSNCMMFFYPQDNIAAHNFLDTPLEEIQSTRLKSRLCRRCRAQALHRYCNVYNTEHIEGAAA